MSLSNFFGFLGSGSNQLEISLFSIIIMGFLLAMSAVSWAIILGKFLYLSGILAKSNKISRILGKSSSYAEAQKTIKSHGSSYHKSLLELTQRNIAKIVPGANQGESPRVVSGSMVLEILTGLSNKHIQVQKQSLEKNLSILATISSSAPFIGLLGTVIGVVISFRDIVFEQATSLAVVAPGISEALLATAMGLFASIPALIFYNFFKARSQKILILLDACATEINSLAIISFIVKK